jgi:hypothetical protein
MDLTDLARRVRQAAAEQREPPPPGGSKPLLPVEHYLSEEDLTLLWRAVRAVRRLHPEVFGLFTEVTLASLIVDHLAEGDGSITLAELAGRLEVLAGEDGPWLVSTPICNIAMSESVLQLGTDVVLERAHLGAGWIDDPAIDDDQEDPFAVHRLLGDRLRRPTEWLRIGERCFDTRRGAHLLTVEEGNPGIALPRARAKAQYAMAVWTILSPPERREMLPDLGIWMPQPHLQFRQRYKRREHGNWITRERDRGGGIWEWEAWPARDVDVLRAPFEAIERRERRAAQALLSASWALFQAARGSRFQLTEQLRGVRTAIEVLCERSPGAGGVDRRWESLTHRLDVWPTVAVRGYGREDIEELERRLHAARNIATHGADAALIDLGYPKGHERPLRGRPAARSEDLSFSALHADLSPLLGAVRYAVARLFELMRANDWDEAVFEAQFQK